MNTAEITVWNNTTLIWILSGPWEQHGASALLSTLFQPQAGRWRPWSLNLLLHRGKLLPLQQALLSSSRNGQSQRAASPHSHCVQDWKSAGPTRWGTQDQFPLASFHALLAKISLTNVLSQPHSPQRGTELLFVPANWRRLFGALTSLLPQKELLYTPCAAVDTATSTRLYNFAPRSSLPRVEPAWNASYSGNQKIFITSDVIWSGKNTALFSEHSLSK